MKKILLIFFTFLIFGCGEKESNKTEEKNIIVYFLLSLAQTIKPAETCFNDYSEGTCPAVLTYYTTNIKSFKVYQNGNLIFENPISNETIFASNGCSGGGVYPGKGTYGIKFQNNLYLKGLLTYAFKNGNFCGVKLEKQDGTILQYEMSFNGDLNTFTELTVGDYKFIPVR